MKIKNTPIKIIQIVPQLPPYIDGVGDYALNLARQLRQDFNIKTKFLVGDPNLTEAKEIENFSIDKLNERSADNLLSILCKEPLDILLHYVGYGYAKRGCPIWLVDGLQKWRANNSQGRLITMFHEIYASGPIWSSGFWLSSLQKNLATRLTKLSDHCLTSKQDYAEILYDLGQDKHNSINPLPVFSNIGEPEFITPLAKRPRRLVIFGHPNSRLKVYQQSLKALEQVCHVLEIEEICDIGVSTGLVLSKLTKIPIREMGIMQAQELSDILLQSIAGLLKVPPPDFLAKSTIFAAYCAHGVLPVLTVSSSKTIDGLDAHKHYWVADDHNQQISLNMAQAIADNAHAWYQTHSLPIQAKILAHYLENRS